MSFPNSSAFHRISWYAFCLFGGGCRRSAQVSPCSGVSTYKPFPGIDSRVRVSTGAAEVIAGDLDFAVRSFLVERV